MKRKLCAALSILTLLALMLAAVPPASAAPSTAGCKKSPDGQHLWSVRPQSPWCTRPGGNRYICRYCSKEVFEQTTPALGHNWGEWKVTKKATCSSQGSRTRICARCDEVETKAIPTTGHSYGEWTVTTPPACEQEGEQTHVCAECGRVETKPAPALGHDWDEGVITKAPTATEDGVLTYTCKNDPSHVKTEPIPATGEVPPEEPKPSLYISSFTSDCVERLEGGISYHNYYFSCEVTVINTGNIPLAVYPKKDNSVRKILQPGESLTYTTNKIYRHTDSFEWHSETSEIGSGYEENRTFTMDDPVYYAYFVAKESLFGYGVDGHSILDEKLCQSNEVSLTFWFRRDSVPEEEPSALSLKKTASAPGNGEYFEAGEPIHWGLTVTNTTDAPVTDVTVTDKGANVGSFASIAPGESQPCSVPDHVVTDYEAVVVGYVKNVAVAEGKDGEGNEGSWPSNEATALTKKPLGKDEDPLGPVYGKNVSVSLIKAEISGPANGEYYQLNETIHYTITVRNTGDEELKDLNVADSLAGFAVIGSVSSLAPGAEKVFSYSYTVQPGDIGHSYVVNSTILTFSFGDGISGTPRISTVYSKLNGTIPPGFDPELLPRDGDYCSLTLDALGTSEARYTLHACTEHLPAAEAAEAAAQEGDWDQAAAIWRGKIEKQYALLYEAGDSEAKSAVMAEKALFDTFMGKYADAVNTEDAARMRADTDRMYDMLLNAATGSRREALLREREQLYATIEAFGAATKGEALTEALRLRCMSLCCAIHTMPERRPDSLAGQHTILEDNKTFDANAREIGSLNGSDSEVVERYDETGATAFRDTVRLAAGGRPSAFRRAAVLWQMALDDTLNPVYEAAGNERRQAIAAWRITLDSLAPAEKSLLALMYGDRSATAEEQLMNLYRDAALNTEHVR